MERVPERFFDLFEKRTVAHLATQHPDGAPHVTPVWIDHDPEAGTLLVNTATGRQKERNVRRDPAVGVSMTDPDDPYRWLSVRGRVVERREAGAVEHIDALARHYMDVEEYPNHGEEAGSRVVLVIEPHAVAPG